MTQDSDLILSFYKFYIVNSCKHVTLEFFRRKKIMVYVTGYFSFEMSSHMYIMCWAYTLIM